MHVYSPGESLQLPRQSSHPSLMFTLAGAAQEQIKPQDAGHLPECRAGESGCSNSAQDNPSYTAISKRKRHLYHTSISMSHKAQLCIKGGFIIYKHSRFAAVCRDYSIPKFCSAVAMLLNPGGLVGSATCTTNPASSDSKPSKVLDTYTHHCGNMYGTECIMLML